MNRNETRRNYLTVQEKCERGLWERTFNGAHRHADGIEYTGGMAGQLRGLAGAEVEGAGRSFGRGHIVRRANGS
jgi:hypothetical protein